KIGRPGFGVCRAEAMLPGNGEKLVATGLLYSLPVHEDERVVREKGLSAETGRYRLDVLEEFQCKRTRAQERLYVPRMRLARIGGHDGLLQRQEIFAGADDEPVVRQRDYIRRAAAREIEPDGHSPRLG